MFEGLLCQYCGQGNHCGRLCQGCRANRRRVYCVSGGFTFVITNVIIFVGLLVVLQVQIPSSKLNTYNSAPGDTHIISYSSTFCNGVMASDTEGEASLYLLKSKPPLSGPVNNLRASPPTTIEADTYHYLEFSELDMKYCLNETSSSPAVSFFLIKGSDNWDGWANDGSSSHSKISFPINNLCSGGNNTQLYNFTSTDYYYFAFDNLDPLIDIQIDVSILLQRTEYIATENNTIENCYDSCNVPYQSHHVVLLSVDNEYTYVGVFCEPRLWVYVLIVVISFPFLVVTVFFLCVLCDYARHRRAGYMTLNRGQPSVNTRAASGPAPVNAGNDAMPSSPGQPNKY